MAGSIRPIAIYLPQFHPIPENDEWWGKGFTEWTNVAKAKPLFKGHHQPKFPSDLGYYDLRLPKILEEQADLARSHGIFGFCFYHYWFGGKRLLNKPIDEMVSSGKPDFPFMLFWANETWSRRWLGEDKVILIKQTYSREDDQLHANWLCNGPFRDARYIKINNRPVFMIYRPNDLPDYRGTIEIIKETAIRNGLHEPYIIGSNANSHSLSGFDNVLNFEPQLSALPNAFTDGFSLGKWFNNMKLGVNSFYLKIYDYTKVKKIMSLRKFPYSFLPCVFVGWDNSARRGKEGIIIVNQNTSDFRESLVQAKEIVKHYPPEEQFVFINAWNEWAEGNYLEPCSKFGHSFLKTVESVFKS